MISPGLYVLEHKTTSESLDVGSGFWRRLEVSHEPSMYIRAAQELGHDVQGVLYDVIKKPTLRLKKNESPETFRDRIVNEQYAAKPDEFLKRHPVLRLSNQVDEAHREIWQYAEQIHEARKHDRFPKNPDACFSYNSNCEYLGVCTGEWSLQGPHYQKIPRNGLVKLSKSSLSMWRSCQRKYQFAHEMGYRPIAKSMAMRMGSHFHEAIEVWSKSNHDLELARQKLTKVDDQEEWAKLDAMMVAYHAMYESVPLETFAIEGQFDAPLHHPDSGKPAKTFFRTGRVDALVRVK